MFAKLLVGGEISHKTLKRAQESTFVVINKPRQQYSSFVLLIILASIIATGGIAAESTAVIVGSMLIAPLMSPMIGVALAAVLGRPHSTVRALLITCAGMALSIVISILMALIIPIGIDTASNSQILSRTTPRLVDLLIALASSFTASIVIMREDTPDALAGVAISASIIPPLCVTGVALAQGDLTSAKGSFLLFLTNFFAIQVAGMATFAALGLGSAVYSNKSKRMRAIWYSAIIIGVIAIAVPLTLTSNSIIDNAVREKTIRATATTWLQGTSYRLSSIDVDSGHVSIEVIGSGTEPSMKQLGARLKEIGVDVQDIRMAVIHEQWYRPSVHPDVSPRAPEEVAASQSDQEVLELGENEESQTTLNSPETQTSIEEK